MSFESDIIARLKDFDRRLKIVEARQRAGNGNLFTVTNLTLDRTYDANATSTAELADILGTLITDLASGKTPKV